MQDACPNKLKTCLLKYVFPHEIFNKRFESIAIHCITFL